MTQSVATEVPARPKLGIRTGSSRKLLERKALETAAAAGAPAGEALEDSFPPVAADQAGEEGAADGSEDASTGGVKASGEPEQGLPVTTAPALSVPVSTAAPSAPLGGTQEPAQTTPELATAPQAPPLPTAAAWSAEDESAFQALAARRKAEGYQRRGRDVSDQIVRLGGITPNPNTVVAVIVGLVAEQGGSVGRAELVASMAGATYPHGKARPDDKGWCQGYVAGAVRNGFLALVDDIGVNNADAA